jgi:hypothetical protein
MNLVSLVERIFLWLPPVQKLFQPWVITMCGTLCPATTNDFNVLGNSCTVLTSGVWGFRVRYDISVAFTSYFLAATCFGRTTIIRWKCICNGNSLDWQWIRWRWVVSFRPLPVYPKEKKPRYPLNLRLSGLQIRYGNSEKHTILLPLTVIEARLFGHSACSQSQYQLSYPGP